MSDEQQKSIAEETRDDVKDILKILNGNGNVGMCAKVSILWKTSIFVIAAIGLILIKQWF